MALTVGSLFSGIGGIDLGLERAGMDTRWFVEWDAHCQNVLRRHWPGVPVYGDITAVDWGAVEPIDVLAGGFPCQPVSAAGLQRAQADDRWLWPAFAAAIHALRPRYVLVENVRNLLAVNGGRAFGEVVGTLAEIGYDAEWDCIPAAAIGAPHLRDRLWLVAYPSSDGWPRSGSGNARRDNPPTRRQRLRTQPTGDSAGHDAMADAAINGRGEGSPRPPWASRHAAIGGQDVADAERPGLEGTTGTRVTESGRTPSIVASGRPSHPDAIGQRLEGIFAGRPEAWAADGPRDGRDTGWWVTEPDVGRVADGVPHRVDRLRALGNAVVPQVVEWIGRRIVAFDAEREAVA